jgi:hypothetical protein
MSIVARHMTTSRNRASSDILLVSWIALLVLPMYALYVYYCNGTTGTVVVMSLTMNDILVRSCRTNVPKMTHMEASLLNEP